MNVNEYHCYEYALALVICGTMQSARTFKKNLLKNVQAMKLIFGDLTAAGKLLILHQRDPAAPTVQICYSPP